MKIRLASVTKTFRTFRAIRDVTLEIGSGELVALLGPSGSGKTTILRMVAGLEFPDAGQIFFGEQDATGIPVRDRGVGFVFQHYALFPHMTVARNIEFGMKSARQKRPADARAARVAELLGLMRLDGLADRFPAQLSGGQRQRVALARALAVDPRVLLLDEPFGALDANVRRDLRRWLRDIHEELGITTLFVTHDQEEALDLADRVVILNEGRIVQQGSPADIVKAPNSAFVMRFLGDANSFEASVRDGQAWLAEGVAVPAPGMEDGAAQVFARPGDLGWDQAGGGLPARIRRVLSRPGASRLVVESGANGLAEIDVDPDHDLKEGDTGSIRFVRARVFPAD